MSRYLILKNGFMSLVRSVDSYIPLEMFGLWIIECILVDAVFYCLLAHDIWSQGAAAHIDAQAFQQANVCALTISITSVAIGLYRSDICIRRGKFMFAAAIVSLLLAPAMIGLSHIFNLDLDPGSQSSVVRIFAAWMACLFVTRIGFYVVQRFDLLVRRVLVVGSAQSAVRIQNVIDASGKSFCRVVGVVAPDAAPLNGDALCRDRIWSVVLADDSSAEALPRPDDFSKLRNTQVFAEAAFCENRLQRLDTANLPDDWNDVVARSSSGQWVDTMHRCLDILVSLGVVLVTLPLMAVVVFALKIESRGPVFYRQERVGRHGRVFILRKFRSMVVDAEAVGAPIWAAQNDPRVTKVGRLIRRTRIDELPQILNVLAGEMSFIGPRPERPHFVERLGALIPGYADRACLKPGITGWAQVKFPYGASVEDARMKLAYDLYYVKHRSLFLNLLILVSTVRVILFQEGSR